VTRSGESPSSTELFEDYPTRPVPADVGVSGWRIALINSALALSLSGLVAGVQLGAALGLADATVAFVAGGLLLSIVGAVTGYVGVRLRLTSYMIIRYAFGSQGSKLVNLCLALSLFGWFGVNSSLFGKASAQIWNSLSGGSSAEWVFVVGGGVLMTAGAIFGFKSLSLLSAFVVPLQFLILVVLAARTMSAVSLGELLGVPPQGGVTIGEAISAVVGGWIVGAVAAPDLTRYGRTWVDATTAASIPFLFASTFIYVVAAMAGLWSGEDDILAVMLAMGLGLAAFALVGFSSWVTNAANLYGCSLSLTAIFPGLRDWQVVVVSGAAGTVLALLGILDRFIDFVFSLGVIFTPVAGIYTVDFFLLRRADYGREGGPKIPEISYAAFAAWILGVVVAVAANAGLITLSSVPTVDALLTAVVIYWGIGKLIPDQAISADAGH